MLKPSFEIGLIALSGAVALAVLMFMPRAEMTEPLSFDAKLAAIATELDKQTEQGGHSHRFIAARMPEVAAFVVLRPDGSYPNPVFEAVTTLAEKRLLDQVQHLKMPETGTVSWIAQPLNDTGGSIGCYGGPARATCVALHPGAMTLAAEVRGDQRIVVAMLGILLLVMMAGALIRYFDGTARHAGRPSG